MIHPGHSIIAWASPSQNYYLNAGSSDLHYCVGVDYTETVQVTTGATVTLTADAVDAAEIYNVDPSGTPIVVPGISLALAAYKGQFLQMDVVSVTPH